MEELRELQRFQIEALQKENEALKYEKIRLQNSLEKATELLKKMLNDLKKQ